jgi:3-phytase
VTGRTSGPRVGGHAELVRGISCTDPASGEVLPCRRRERAGYAGEVVVVVEKSAVRVRIAVAVALLAGAVAVPVLLSRADEGREADPGRSAAATGASTATPAPSSEATAEPTMAAEVAPPVELSAVAETRPVAHGGDAADDVAFWVDREDPSASIVIGTDKDGALLVYDLSGRERQSLPVGRVNNVDVRGTLVTFTDRSDNTIGIRRVDPDTRRLRDVPGRSIRVDFDVYGACMYESRATGDVFVFVTSTAGQVQQWRLDTRRSGAVDGTLTRSFEVGSKAEGCVADDELGDLYVGEEAVGVWRYGAEPGDGTAREQVARATAEGPLVPDVEGLALVREPGGAGYLIVSSQGNNSFAVYRRQAPHDFVTSFTVADGNGIDGVTDSDGIEVTTEALGPQFPSGVFATQDRTNDGGNQNFKLVPYQEIDRLLD